METGGQVKPIAYLALAALCAALYLWGLGRVPLIGLDEGLYSECSREMLVSGNYVVPHCNSEPFFDKPPLVYWLQAASMRLFGSNSLAARLPSAIAGLVLVAWTVFLGTRLFSPRAGILAGYVLATSILATALARMAILDQLFALSISLALGGFLLSYVERWPRYGYMLFWAASGVSLLIKGPAGLVLIFGTVALFLIVRRDLRAVSKALPLPGIALMLLIALPWYIVVDRATDGAFIREFIVHQNLQRAAGADFNHNQNGWMYVFFYPLIYLALFLPWSVFVPVAWKKQVTLRTKEPAETAALFLAIWLVTVVAVFTVLVSKLTSYVYPAFPASALLVGALWAIPGKAVDRSLRRCIVAALVVAALVAVAMVVGSSNPKVQLPALGGVLASMGAVLFAGALLALILVDTHRLSAFSALAAGTAGFLLLAAQMGMPIAARELSEPVVETGASVQKLSSSERVYMFVMPSQEAALLPFYSRRPIPRLESPADLARARGAGDVVVLATEDVEDILPRGGKLLRGGPIRIYRFSGSSR